jgi:hypothetical protein
MPFGSSANVAKRQRCSDPLGPTQPGVTTPDYTPVTSNGKVHISSAAAAKKAGYKLAATKPLPGQPNYSVPHVNAPASTQQLLQQLQQQAGSAIPSNTPVPQAPSASGPSAQQILDYLLGP